MKAVGLIATVVVVLAAGFVVVIIRLAARRVVMPGIVKTVTVHSASTGTVSFTATPDTLRAGTFGLWSSTHDGHLIVGDIVKESENEVQRTIVRAFGRPLAAGEQAEFRRDLYRNPAEAGLDYSEVDIPTPLGSAPAWLIPGSDTLPWVIHLHGIRTERRVVLPTVRSAAVAGLTSLVPSWRGDGEGPAVPGNASTLGQNESIDVAAAIDYALAHGAPSIILVGWSLGATIALRLASSPQFTGSIDGIILIAPASNWMEIIRFGTRSARLPAVVGSMVAAMLASPIGHRLIGTSTKVSVRVLNWTTTNRVTQPFYVLHNPGDQLVPFELSELLTSRNPGSALEVFDAAPHAMESNTEPDRFAAVVTQWLTELNHYHPGDTL